MCAVSAFSNLTTLTLVALSLTEISGLSSAGQLRELWLNQNCISRISGLSGCPLLRKLDLTSNQISAIEGLDNCLSLETLILNENKITSLEGLPSLKHLNTLYLAQNLITKIGSTLRAQAKLRSLNLAGNLIGNFKEILCLAGLPALRVLTLNDPHFQENPVCNLCNYQTYILYYLPQLTSLDTYSLSEDARNFAEATFVKKKMYYNMRIKTIKRTASNVKRAIRDITLDFERRLFDELRPIEALLKATERELHERALGRPTHDVFVYGIEEGKGNPLDFEYATGLEEALIVNASTIRDCLREEYAHLQTLEDIKHALRLKTEALCKENIGRLVTELETGGNIRFEEGKPSDNWYASCADLVHSRYQSSDFNLQITRVTRLHNRYLRNRFEDKLESLVDMSDSSYKNAIEYLFYETKEPAEISRVMEEGFRSAAEYSELRLPGCVPLTNSVDLAEAARFRALDEGMNRVFALPGKLLVCKVYVGDIVEDLATFLDDATIEEIWNSAPVHRPPFDRPVVRSHAFEPKTKLWFIFDSVLILPEYLVELEYCAKEYESIDHMFGLDNDVERAELASLNLSFSAFMELCKEHRMVEPGTLEPVIPERNSLDNLTEDALLSVGRSSDLMGITSLDLSLNSFKSLRRLRLASNVRSLYASFNWLRNIEDLISLGRLAHLDISYNQVAVLEPLSCLTNLESVNCSHNNLQDIREIFHLKPNKKLETLMMLGNPLATHPRYKQLAIMSLPLLKEMDYTALSETEKTLYSHTNPTVTLELAKSHVLLGDSSAPSGLLSAGEFFLPPSSSFGANWHLYVEIIQLNNQKLLSLEGIDALANLKNAAFIGNFLQDITPLTRCRQIEELSLEDNLLGHVEGISQFTNLRKLDIGKNFIRSLNTLLDLTQLTQLSLEDNLLESLQGVETLTGLLELYIGNNSLANNKELLLLQQLPKLIILDITGNPMTKQQKSRLFVIFTLRKLKVLDGTAVEFGEQTTAKDMFGGRLTEDILESRLNGLQLTEVRSLDLSNQRLRSFENMLNEERLPWLSDLNLSGNSLQNLNCFGPMSRLLKLGLSNNKLVSLDATDGHGLAVLPSLDTLDLSHNQISSMAGLPRGGLGLLRVLVLCHNQISKVECLEGLLSLRELDLSSNQIRQLDQRSFPGSLVLKFLKLDDNRLRSLQYFGGLTKLQSLQLTGNRILDYSELDKLRELPLLMELVLIGNPITKKNPYRINVIKKIPQLLILDSQEVTVDERERIEVTQEQKPAPLIHVIQPSHKVPVKVTAVNFESVFGKQQEASKRPVSTAAPMTIVAKKQPKPRKP